MTELEIKKFAQMVADADNDFEIRVYNYDQNMEQTKLLFNSIIEEVTKKETSQRSQD